MDNVSADLALQGATYFWKSKRSDKAVSSLQANKERAFHVHVLVKSLYSLPKNTFYNIFSVSSLLLILHQISGSFSYKIVHKKRVQCAFAKYYGSLYM